MQLQSHSCDTSTLTAVTLSAYSQTPINTEQAPDLSTYITHPTEYSLDSFIRRFIPASHSYYFFALQQDQSSPT